MMDSIWKIRELSDDEQALTKQLAQELSISELSARMLVVRGIRTADAARKYIRPTLDEINDP
ncbi:MAG: hypothetical protein IJ920_05650, partial [Paludibacteraceae bacterium]|nr:hypothetical protein [Paludibacteraceae bacterium]